IYAYVAALYVVLHVRRPSREHLAFGLTCVAVAVWTAGAALRTDALTTQELVVGLRLSYVGGFGATAFFCDLVGAMAGRRRRRWIAAAYVIGALGILTTATGQLVAESPGEWMLTISLAAGGPPLTPFGAALITASLVPSGHAIVLVLRAARSQRELRPFAAASVLTLAVSVYEAGATILGKPSPHLVEHTFMLQVLAISWLLLRRFVRAADELSARTEELRKSYGELRVAQEELVRKEQLAAVGELSAVIAHEVRNPLAIIKNAVSSLRRPTLRPADRGVLLGILDEEVDRLNRLVRDLLAYARPVEPRGRPVELAATLREVVDGAVAGLEAPEAITVELDLDRCPTVHGDPDLLRQAITNVVDNALSAMSQGGTLTVRAEPARLGSAAAVAIECIDTGEGMDPLVLGKARDPFFTTRASGTGLGLAIVDRVVKNHGGTLAIQSAQGIGTTVRIVLPLERPNSVPPPPEEPA
ncbi:MAG TPA: ATP-binding protein, partial [Sandaracinaceae bacterium]